ncbi:hypothetical protein AJ79_09218 [Helicocarpus griseus UAMH5409]|uniref:BZIP domain-containing protein n=1 Tax=Helicocarpus griseus UAMH5409 TaxID=1447875 RepID=A0A2B7WLD4_9EURO|nr:hypothetical protein AJ79_09218 [Helicocarpus griseus UAMH5409]
MLSEAEQPPKTARKLGRSTSPRAVERRRLQNRVSQRNHRRRVREADQGHSKAHQDVCSDSTLEEARYEKGELVDANTVDCIGHIHSQIFVSSGSDSLSTLPQAGIMVNDLFMADNLLPQQDSSWIRMITGNEDMAQTSFTSQSCSCNSTTGPCDSHFEEISARTVAETTSHILLHQQHQNHHVPNSDIPKPPHPHQTSLSWSSFSKSGGSSSQPLHVAHGVGRHAQSPSTMSPPIGESSSSIGGNVSSPRDLLPRQASGASTADMTRRFGIVLEAMRIAGFHDFDEMSAAYYTAEFEKDSFPAMSQSASRSRRMKPMLQKLQQSSSQWPRWESRGLYKSVKEMAVSLCVGEMERLAEAKVPHPLQTEPASYISAIEWLLWDHGRGIQGSHIIGTSTPEELRLPKQVETAPESMPYLWSMLTEFAGAQGVYCDRFARVVLAILLYARRAQ